MILTVTVLIFSFWLLAFSANRFVDGATSVSYHLGVPPLLIGMLVLGFGTSAPEIIVSSLAALDAKPSIALGNALGSNILNIGLILGATATIKPLPISIQIKNRELPILLGTTLVLGALITDDDISRVDSTTLLVLLFIFIVYSLRVARKNIQNSKQQQQLGVNETLLPIKKGGMWLLIGIVLLISSSRAIVWGSVEIAKFFGLSDLIIGLTIVALGTSLPELAASLAACSKGLPDIALGNVVGSNLFNVLAVIGIAANIKPIVRISPSVLSRDYPVLLGITLLLFFMAKFNKKGQLERHHGLLLLLCCMLYFIKLAMNNSFIQ